MLLGNYEKTSDRKIKELLIAWKIEKQYSKQQILTLYANLHNMGPGIYGVAAAADYYFGKQLKDLTLEECAMIAGLPRNPSAIFPPSASGRCSGTTQLSFWTEWLRAHDLGEDWPRKPKLKPMILKPPAHDDTEIAPHFLEWVRESLAARYSTEEIWRKGMQVYTTLNIEMQKAARKALARRTAQIRQEARLARPHRQCSENALRQPRHLFPSGLAQSFLIRKISS